VLITLQIIRDFLLMCPLAWTVWKNCRVCGNWRCYD